MRFWFFPRTNLCLIFLCGFIAFSASAADIDTLYQPCAACHGAQGEGNLALQAPRLAGQNSVYLERQLNAFKNKQRGYHPDDVQGKVMAQMVQTLSAEDFSLLANYLAELNPGYLDKAAEGDVAAGKQMFNETCRDCHGSQAAGLVQLKSANLTILSGEYLSKQLQAYKKGWRGSDSHSDVYSKWMRSIATHIDSDEEIADIIAFIHSLR